jgi:hypothetical protein
MKKILLSVCLLSFAAIYGFSQSLSLSNASGPIVANSVVVQAGTPDSVELITYFNVKNTSGAAMDVMCKKVEFNMLDSTEITMCWGGGCYPSNTYISPNPSTIGAGETNTEFVGHYSQIAFQHLKVGESVVRWVFYNRSNENDSVSVTVKYTSYPLGIDESIASQGTLSGFYPNPASVVANCNYSVPAGSRGTLVVRDILGTSILTQDLEGSKGKATIRTENLNGGIYFCTLLVDGKISQTKKLIVKH